MEYSRLDDEELVKLGKNGDSDAVQHLIERYRHTVLAVSRSYFLTGGDAEDLVQEGMVGVFRAIMTYDFEKSSFKRYAVLCIKTSILSLIKKSNSNKNKPLNGYISLSGYTDDNDADKSLIVVGEDLDPENNYINKEAELELQSKIKRVLSKLENKILSYYLLGYSYDEIATYTKKDKKCIDNALQRIRKKLSKDS